MKIIPFDPETCKDEQAALSEELAAASAAYYGGGIARMSDLEFDRKLERLSVMEQESGFAYDNSPNVRVGADVVTALEKSVHEQTALSLDKVKYKDREDLVSWLSGRDGVLSWKMDGLTVVLTYDGGTLTKAVTRGNGTEGSVITHNARYFLGLPITIPYQGHLVLRGECTMTNEEFERINALSDGIYENARNLASATIQMLDSNESRKREIRFAAFKLVVPEPEEDFLRLEQERFAWLKEQGFSVVRYTVVDPGNILDTIEEWKQDITRNASPTDGLVLSFDDQVYARELGATGHHPRGSIAMKWTDETVESVLREIEWSVGKTGVITPVAIFDTVRLGLGSNVSRASLHNLSIMKQMPSLEGEGTCQCGIGSRVRVYMANMIIPQIHSCTEGTLTLPDSCPVCGGEVEVKNRNGIETLLCLNPDCSAKHIKRIAAFASKDGMNIEGLSESRIEYLISGGYLHSEADFYTLKDRPEQMEKLSKEDGWGEKSVTNMLQAIERSRDTTLPRFIFALSIPLAGHDLARKLSSFFHGSIEEFLSFMQDPREEDLAQEDGIGPVKAQNVADWCRAVVQNADAWERFRSLVGQLHFPVPDTAETQKETGASLQGMTFVITGAVHQYKNRDEFKASVEARGGKVAGSVSGKTNYLVNNDTASTSGKNRKAQELGIPILSEDAFIEMFGK